MKYIRVLISSALILLIFSNSYSQRNEELTKKEIYSFSKIQLFKNNQATSPAYFQYIDNDTLNVFTELMDKEKGFFLTESQFNLKDFDRITIKDKKSRIRNSFIVSSVLGVSTFFVVKSISKTDAQDALSNALDIRPNSGNLEGVIGGTLAASLGLIVSQNLFKININLNKERTKAIRILEEQSKRR